MTRRVVVPGLIGAVAATVAAVASSAAVSSAAAPRAVVQEERSFVFTDSARVDSLQARVSPDRVEEYRRRAAGEGDPRHWYDLGAILLLAGDWEGAIEPLERVVTGPESDVAEAATYNLGVAHGVGGRPPESPGPAAEATSAARRAGLLRAREAFRGVLRDDPGAEDARWNLEVVDHWLEQLGGDGGGGGGGDGGDGGEGGDARREMTPEEVQRLLDAAASEERRVQEERFQRSRSRDPVAERNW